jgi:DNA invertase Pin-like site-specific DNA recombinase
MSKASSNFRRTDVKRAIQAAASAGLKIGRIELTGSTVVLVPDDGNVADEDRQRQEVPSLDDWMATRARSA